MVKKRSLLDKANSKQISGYIWHEEKPEWNEYKKRCKENNISITYEGFSDMLLTNNRLNRLLFPMANKLKTSPMEFKNKIIESIVTVLEGIDTDAWGIEIEKIQESAKKEINDKVIVKLVSTIKDT